MTRSKIERTIAWALRRHNGAPVEQQAAAICDAIELLMQAEDEAALTMASDKPNPPQRPVLPPSPAIEKSLIVSPDSEEGRQALEERKRAPVVPIAVDTLIGKESVALGKAQQTIRPWWKMGALSEEIQRATPPEITITVEHPERGPVEILLERNVQSMPGVNSADAVKLIYKSPAAGDDLAASQTFWTTDHEIDLHGAMEKIISAAQSLYRPRPRIIENRTPVLNGSLRFDETTPHMDTDKIYRGDGTYY